jgi:hypothetical protein
MIYMFRKYEKTFRMPGLPDNLTTIGKYTLSGTDAKNLLNGNVTVEEKIDGANIGIIRHKTGYHLQKRGSLVGQSEHAQYQFFHNWASKNYDKIMAFPKNYIVYGELMFLVHHIYYDQLPDWVIVFDIWNGENYLDRERKEEFCLQYDMNVIPLIYTGQLLLNQIPAIFPKKSAYGERAEGMVIKRYKKKEMLKAKVVDPAFVKEIGEIGHWRRQKLKKNTQKPL